jgi:nitrate/nitrite transporter NarK
MFILRNILEWLLNLGYCVYMGDLKCWSSYSTMVYPLSFGIEKIYQRVSFSFIVLPAIFRPLAT